MNSADDRRVERPAVDWILAYRGMQSATVEDRGDARTRVERARSFIDAHLDGPLDLDRLAREACFSRYHFLRQFKAEFGDTPHQYVTSRRIARARHLLETTDRSITEICLDVGFSSLGSFSTLFQRHVGHSPSRYRRRHFESFALPVPQQIPACFLWAYAPR